MREIIESSATTVVLVGVVVAFALAPSWQGLAAVAALFVVVVLS